MLLFLLLLEFLFSAATFSGVVIAIYTAAVSVAAAVSVFCC